MSKKINLTFSRNFILAINNVFDKLSEAEYQSALAAAILPEKADGETYGQWIDRVAPIKKTLDYAGHTKLAQDARKEAQSAALNIVPERMICAIKGTFDDMPEITETGSDKILAEYKIGQKTVKINGAYAQNKINYMLTDWHPVFSVDNTLSVEAATVTVEVIDRWL